MRKLVGLLIVLSLARCGGDDKKVTTTSCAGDADCSGGLCFDSVCYTVCTDSIDPCAEGEACLLRTRDDGDHAICVAAAQVQCATHDDCAEVHSRECLHAKCDPDSLVCTFAELPDFSDCFDYVPNATTEAAPPGYPFAGACFHGECQARCTINNDCPDVCALKRIGNDELYCGASAQLACRADGFGEEFADACSSVWKREGSVCEFSFSAEGPGTTVAANCEGGPSACLTEGCAVLCKTDADCPGTTCRGFYSYDSLPDDTGIGFFKACRK